MINLPNKWMPAIGFVLLSIMACAPVHAEEPMQGVSHKFKTSKYLWRIEGGRSPVLSLFKDQSETPLGRYELSGCSFCSGEGDNCESDGVSEITLPSKPEEPILAVTCHVGAHSQPIQIFAPFRKQHEAVYTATGAYYVTSSLVADGIAIEYDFKSKDGTFQRATRRWP
jgi:hypothetical protein